jgi:hypothetical protein
MRLLYIAMGCVFMAFPVVSELEQGREDVWVYEGGWFQRVEGNKWIEVNVDVYDFGKGKWHFREIEKKKDFIELVDESRKLLIRLHHDFCETRREDQREWSLLYKGHWKK